MLWRDKAWIGVSNVPSIGVILLAINDRFCKDGKPDNYYYRRDKSSKPFPLFEATDRLALLLLLFRNCTDADTYRFGEFKGFAVRLLKIN